MGMTYTESREWYLKGLGIGNDELAAVMTVVCVILEQRGYPEYSSAKSKKTFSDRCKIGLLVLKECFDVSYRTLCMILHSMPGVLAAGNMQKVPEHSTLRKFASRVDRDVLGSIVAETSLLICGPDVVGAVDSTGYSESNASRHFVTRMKQMGAVVMSVKDYAKVTLAADVTSKAVMGCIVSPSGTADVKTFAPVLESVARTGVNINAVLGDKGFDAEYAHRDARRILGNGVETWIPPREPKKNKPADWTPGGKYRKIAYKGIAESRYNDRSQIETVNSMMKRTTGDRVYGKSMSTIVVEILCTIIYHNLKILLRSGWVT